MSTHISMTFFLLALLVAGAVILWVYTHRSRLRQIRNTKLFHFSRPRGKLIGPSLFKIKLTEGVFIPDRVHLQINTEYRFQFTRLDTSSSAQDVYIPYFHQRISLEMHKPKEINMTFKEVGQFLYTCSNGLYKGWIIVTH